MRLILLMLMVLAGCASPPPKEVAVACQVADAGTTIYGKHIGAVEDNPLMQNNNVLVAVKAGVIALIVTQWEHINDFGKWAVTVISCAPVGLNIEAIREQQKLNREQ